MDRLGAETLRGGHRRMADVMPAAHRVSSHIADAQNIIISELKDFTSVAKRDKLRGVHYQCFHRSGLSLPFIKSMIYRPKYTHFFSCYS